MGKVEMEISVFVRVVLYYDVFLVQLNEFFIKYQVEVCFFFFFGFGSVECIGIEKLFDLIVVYILVVIFNGDDGIFCCFLSC